MLLPTKRGLWLKAIVKDKELTTTRLWNKTQKRKNLEMRAPLIRSSNAIIRKIIVFICLGKWAKDGLKMEMLLL